MFLRAPSMQFWKLCREFFDKKPGSFRSLFQIDRTITIFSKKMYSAAKNSTEHVECNNDYHDARIRQKAKKGSLKVPQQRKKLLPNIFPWTRRINFCEPWLKLYIVRPNARDPKLLEGTELFSIKSTYPQQIVPIDT